MSAQARRWTIRKLKPQIPWIDALRIRNLPKTDRLRDVHEGYDLWVNAIHPRALNFKVHHRLDFVYGKAKEKCCDFGSARVLRSLGIDRNPPGDGTVAGENRRRIRRECADKMLENEKKRRGRKVVRTIGLVRAEVYNTTRPRQESERRWHVVGLEAFTRNISLTKNIQAASW